MKDNTIKFKLVYLRFIAVAAATIIIYSAFTYAFVIKTELLKIRLDILQFIIPMGLSFLVLMVFLRPRLRILNFEKKGDDRLSVLVYVLATFSIAVPSIVLESYIETAAGKLTHLSTVEKIAECPKTRYYLIDNVFIDKSHGVAESDFYTTGKTNSTLNYRLFIACPMLSFESDSIRQVPQVWYGIEYRGDMSNRLKDDEKDKIWKLFYNKSIDDFNKKNLLDYKYLDRIAYSTEFKLYRKAILKSSLITDDVDELTILVPQNEPFETRNRSKLPWVFGSFLIGAILVYLSIAWAPFHDERYRRFRLGKPDNNEELKASMALVIPKANYFFTPIIMYLNFLIFIVMAIAGLGFIAFKADAVLDWGANYRPLVVQGQYWRLFTSIFLHGGFIHVLMNCYGLIFAGIFLEPAIGKWRFGIAYLTTGILASLSSIIWHEATVSVGASGAIFGIYGVFLSLLTTKYFDDALKSFFLINAGIFVVYNLLMGIAGGIDNAAHIGGLISGFIMGYILYLTLKGKKYDFSE